MNKWWVNLLPLCLVLFLSFAAMVAVVLVALGNWLATL